MKKLTQADVEEAAERVADLISFRPPRLYGVPSGGIPAVYLVQTALAKFECTSVIVDNPQDCDVIIDDVIASDRTRDSFREKFPEKPFHALFLKKPEDDWLIFPWDERSPLASAWDIPIRLIEFLGEDITREGLKETPDRYLKAWQHWTSGYKQDPGKILTIFKEEEYYDEMIFQGSIPMWSTCEHHLSPFFGLAHVAYIPNQKIVGLSKLARLVDVFARRLQIQERLTAQIADCMVKTLDPNGVGVVLQCRHSCMESRGIEKMGTITTTSALRGAIKAEPDARSEFLAFVRGAEQGKII